MQNATPKPVNDQEIDLLLLFKSLGGFFDKLGFIFYRVIRFLRRNLAVTVILLLLGLGWGIYNLLNDPRAYKHTVIVVPNFKSTTYLYNEIENFQWDNAKHKDKLKHVNKLEVKPLVDVFQFVSDREQNLQIARYMSENTIEVSKYKKNNNVEKLYKYHEITYYTDVKDTDGSISKALIEELNDDPYFKERQQIEIADTRNKLKEYETSVISINNIFNKLETNGTEAAKGLNVEIFSEMDKVFEKKNLLLEDINKAKIAILEQSKVIYDVSRKLNIQSGMSIFMVFLYPTLFLVLFVFFAWVVKQFKRYNVLAQQN